MMNMRDISFVTLLTSVVTTEHALCACFHLVLFVVFGSFRVFYAQLQSGFFFGSVFWSFSFAHERCSMYMSALKAEECA